MSRNIHTDFLSLLQAKEAKLVATYMDLREFLLGIAPDSNELLYHTHALTSVHTPSEKMGDAFCHIPIYSEHLNLGFNHGTQLEDPHKLLQGTGKSIRHIPIKVKKDYRNKQVKDLVIEAIRFSKDRMKGPPKFTGETISKIRN